MGNNQILALLGRSFDDPHAGTLGKCIPKVDPVLLEAVSSASLEQIMSKERLCDPSRENFEHEWGRLS